MNNGIIVCGLGHVGYRITALLNRLGEKVTVIYLKAPPEWINQVEKQGTVCLKGNAGDEQLLEKAGVRNARAIIAATDQDMVNLSVVMDARRLNPGIVTIIRMFDQSLARHLETALNIRKVLSASSLASPVFTSAALGQSVIGYFAAHDRPYTVSELRIDPGSTWINMTLDELARTGNLTPLFNLSGGTLFSPNAGQTVKEGDLILVLREARQLAAPQVEIKEPHTSGPGHLTGFIRKVWHDTSRTIKYVIAALASLVITGTLVFHYTLKIGFADAVYFVITTVTTTGYGDYNLSTASTALKLFGCLLMLSGAALMAVVFGTITDIMLKARFKELFRMPPMPQTPHVVIVGRQNTGTRIIDELRHAHLEVVLIDDIPGDIAGAAPGKDIHVIQGDPRSEATLLKAGINSATALIAITDNDILNLGVGLQAKKMNPAVRTVIRTFDAALGKKLQSHLGIDNVLSVSAVSAPTFAGALIGKDVIQGIVWKEHLIIVQFNDTGPCAEPDRPTVASVTINPDGAGKQPTFRISALRLNKW